MASAPKDTQHPSLDDHQYRLLVESVTEYAIYMINPDGIVASWNPGAERFKGYQGKEIIGQHFSRFYTPEDQASGAPQRTLDMASHEGRFETRGWRVRKDGSPFWADVVVETIRTEDGSLLGFAEITRDVTEQMEAQRKIDDANAELSKMNAELEIRVERRARDLELANENLVAAGEARLLLAREVDHRAKNVLAVVQAVVSLTRASTKDEFIAAVRGRVSALARAHSLLADNRWEGANLAQIIAEEISPFQRPGQIHMVGPTIRLEPNAVQPLSLLFHELATNAVKYGALSQENGRVDIEFEILPSEAISLRWRESGGPPVSPPQARGFGSTLISEVTTRQLSGTLAIDWLPVGMQFSAVLPASVYRPQANPGHSLPSDSKVVPIGEKTIGRVLVVEDESLLALELCSILIDLGWDVIGPAGSVAEAIQLLDVSDPVDVAVLDVNLDGSVVYPLAERLESEGVPFVFGTGYAQLDDIRYRDRPVVRKPINSHELVGEMRRAVGLLAV